MNRTDAHKEEVELGLAFAKGVINIYKHAGYPEPKEILLEFEVGEPNKLFWCLRKKAALLSKDHLKINRQINAHFRLISGSWVLCPAYLSHGAKYGRNRSKTTVNIKHFDKVVTVLDPEGSFAIWP